MRTVQTIARFDVPADDGLSAAVGARCSDTGNAARFVRRNRDRLRFCYPMNSWLLFDGRVWKADATGVPVAGWAPGTVRAILMRELYRGQVVWNKTRKRDAFRQVNQQPRPESEWLRADAPHLRIIDESLWKRVQSRRQGAETLAARLAGGRLSGRPPKTPTQNLLSGKALCGICGGSLIVETNSRKRGSRVPEYICYRHRANGTCTNTLRFPVADLNEAVLQAIERHALTPEAIEQVIRLSERDDVAERQTTLERERKDNAKRISRLVTAIADGVDAASVATKLRELEARQQKIVTELAGLRPVPRLPATVVESRLAEWRRLLRGSVTQARTVLDRILCGRLTFTPVEPYVEPWLRNMVVTKEGGDCYEFRGPTRFDRLFSGIVVEGERPARYDESFLACVGFGPEDTGEADYERLLARAYESSVEVLASPTGTADGWQLPVEGFSDLSDAA